MSRTDNTMPWRLREEDLPALPWTRILNTPMNAFGRRELRRWHHSERAKARKALRNARYRDHSLYGADQPDPLRTRHSVRWDMW